MALNHVKSKERRKFESICLAGMQSYWWATGQLSAGRERVNLEDSHISPAVASRPAGNVELSIVMPCLNEAETLETCILKANRFLAESQVEGEIVVGDNGSTDGSQEIAVRNGARGAVILDGRVPHACLLELFTDAGPGTIIRR